MPDAPTIGKAFHAIPVFGWIARDIAEDPDCRWYALVMLLTAFVLSLMAWGIMVVSLLAMATVPVVFAILMLITLG